MAKKKFAIDENIMIDKEQEENGVVNKGTEQKQNKKNTPIIKKQTKKDTHKSYSFWANKEQIEVWRCYQESKKELKKAEDLGLNAIKEYIKNHPLEKDEQTMYELKLKEKCLENSEYR